MNETNQTYYGTPRIVQEFATQRYHRTGKRITFPKALLKLRQREKLSTVCPPLPPFPDHMTPDQFIELILDLPFEAMNIINTDESENGQGTVLESGIFPPGKDVFCFKHMPYMDLSEHHHDFFEITYLYRGSCTLLFENQKIQLTEGELCIIPPMSPHNQPVDADALALGIVVRKTTFNSIFGELLTRKDLVSTFFRNSLHQSTKNNYLILKTEIHPQIRNIIHQLAYECSLQGPYANICSISLLNLFLALTLRRYRDNVTVYRMEELANNYRDFPLMLRYIQQHFNTVSLSSLARAFNYSESHICRLIQKNLNKSFTAIVRELKMARAQDYLKNTFLQVAEIATMIGYESVDHFSRTFKKTFGASPLKYRKEHQNL